MQNCLVTGCAGFIGSHITDFLLNRKFNVIGIDNLSTGREKFLEHNLEKLYMPTIVNNRQWRPSWLTGDADLLAR